jgi:hypothetical protein
MRMYVYVQAENRFENARKRRGTTVSAYQKYIFLLLYHVCAFFLAKNVKHTIIQYARTHTHAHTHKYGYACAHVVTSAAFMVQ